MGSRGTPTTVIGEGPDRQIIIGFDQRKLGRALGI
jgi:hypothetical protein